MRGSTGSQIFFSLLCSRTCHSRTWWKPRYCSCAQRRPKACSIMPQVCRDFCIHFSSARFLTRFVTGHLFFWSLNPRRFLSFATQFLQMYFRLSVSALTSNWLHPFASYILSCKANFFVLFKSICIIALLRDLLRKRMTYHKARKKSSQS